MKMPLAVWTFTQKDMPGWRSWECFAQNVEALYVRLEKDYGRTKAMAETMGLIPVEVLTSDLPQTVRIQDKIQQVTWYGWPE